MLSSLSTLSLLALVFAATLASAESSHEVSKRTSARRHRALSLKQRALSSVGGWSSVGCTDDSAPTRALSSFSQDLGATATIQDGLLICQKKGFKLASLQYSSQLSCGNSGLGSELPAARCSNPCKGDSTQTCGGSYASSSYSLSPAGSTIPSGWAALGCTQDSSSKRALTGYTVLGSQTMTPQQCIQTCQQKGFSIASTEFGTECYCGDKFENSQGALLSPDRCDKPCAGDSSLACGGSGVGSTYVLVDASAVSTTTTTTTSTATSTSTSASASPTSSVSLPSGWQTSGCAQDGPARALTGYNTDLGSSATISSCISVCAAKGYGIAGVQYGSQCYCDSAFRNSLGATISADKCDSACKGDSSTKCGGSYTLSVFTNPALLAGLPAGWSAAGCRQDGPARMFTGYSTDLGSTATIASCVKVCEGKGFGLAGIQYGSQCSCDSAYRNSLGSVVSTDQCNSDCKGDSSTKCGGSYLNTVYSNAGLLAGLPTGWSAVGCTTDGPARALTGYSTDLGASATVPACIKVCADKGYSHSSMQYGSQCYCDSALRNGLGTVVPDDQCSSPCKGDTSTSCGGSYRSNLFKSSNPPASATASSTSSASAAPTVSSAPGWTSIGCTQDGPSRALTSKYVDLGSSATTEACLKICQDGGWVLASLEYGSQCMCGSSFSGNLGGSISSSSCSVPCKGNAAQMCGGSYIANTYKFTGSLVSSASSASSAPTSSATSLSGGSWAYYGCTTASQSTSWTSGGTGGYTQEVCEQTCLQKGSVIAALEYGGQCRCFAKQSDLGGKVDDSQCMMRCTANDQQFCGGNSLTTVFVNFGAGPGVSAPATSTSSAAAPVQTWISAGCASDYPYSPMAGRTLTGSMTSDPKMTNQMCWAICKKGGFTIAGTQGGTECWCGNMLNNSNGASVSASDCSQNCAGDSSQKCGGGWRLSLYKSPDRPKWTITQSASGGNFFNHFWWFSGNDPTNGYVNYVDYPEAFGTGLASISSSGNALMKVESTPVIALGKRGRSSVRISTHWKFNANSLLIMDAVHMPVGCGVWPAWWTLGGGDWPYTGEGISFFDKNQGSVHTASGCTIPTNFGGTGALNNPNCAAYETSNQGCGIVQTDGTPNYGVRFNQNGGGVYAMSWTDEAISIYFFPRGAIPDDIASGNPDPDNGRWPLPFARYPSNSCKLSNYFKDHAGIFDTTFCGDWAGSNWKTNNNYAGQPATCAALTGVDTCEEYVRTRGGDFSEAYWEVKSVKLYNR